MADYLSYLDTLSKVEQACQEFSDLGSAPDLGSAQAFDDKLINMYKRTTYMAEGQSSLGRIERLFYQSQDDDTKSRIETIIRDAICTPVATRGRTETVNNVITALRAPTVEEPDDNDQLASGYSRLEDHTATEGTAFTDEQRRYYHDQDELTKTAILNTIWQNIAIKGQNQETREREYNNAISNPGIDPATSTLVNPPAITGIDWF
jgi:hypothetical protein